MNDQRGEIIIYQAKDGKTALEVKLQQETVWLSQAQMCDLFDKNKRTISEHIRNIFKEGELSEHSVVRNFRTTAKDGKSYEINYYNLDVIIFVGYRVKSQQGTQFRIWATNVLKKHLVDGYTLNEKRLKAVEHKYRELQRSIMLLSNVVHLESISDETKGLIQVITDYSRALDILDDYDHQRLSIPKGTKKASFELTYEEARKIIDVMRKKFKDSPLVGQEKDRSFKGSLGAIYQTFDGEDVYPTIEDKAPHLFYFVTKNHSFVDGNKRIAAALFICFLQRNSILFCKNGMRRIDENALVALTLMIAASRPQDKDAMIKVILNLLA